MKELTSAERGLRVLRREEPERIPHFEWIIDRRVTDAICPGSSMEEFTVPMGLDAILTAPDYRNVEFRLGEIESLPVANVSVDAIISNRVVNLSPDKCQTESAPDFAPAHSQVARRMRFLLRQSLVVDLPGNSVQTRP